MLPDCCGQHGLVTPAPAPAARPGLLRTRPGPAGQRGTECLSRAPSARPAWRACAVTSPRASPGGITAGPGTRKARMMVKELTASVHVFRRDRAGGWDGARVAPEPRLQALALFGYLAGRSPLPAPPGSGTGSGDIGNPGYHNLRNSVSRGSGDCSVRLADCDERLERLVRFGRAAGGCGHTSGSPGTNVRASPRRTGR